MILCLGRGFAVYFPFPFEVTDHFLLLGVDTDDWITYFFITNLTAEENFGHEVIILGLRPFRGWMQSYSAERTARTESPQ